jgi:hypothetical protein
MALVRRAFSTVELVIYISLLAVVVMVGASIFKLSQRTTETTNSNYFLNADAETAVSWLRRDLQQAALVTIQTYPATRSSEPPGISFCSALESDNVKKLDANDEGHPSWHNHVYYTLKRGREAQVGTLMRWSVPLAEQAPLIPTLAPLLPSALNSPERKPIHNRVLMPNQELFGVAQPDGKIDQFGGFRLRFVRRDQAGKRQLVDTNPSSQVTAQKSRNFVGTTRLVEVELKFLTSANSGKLSFYSLRFSVFCRH